MRLSLDMGRYRFDRIRSVVLTPGGDAMSWLEHAFGWRALVLALLAGLNVALAIWVYPLWAHHLNVAVAGFLCGLCFIQLTKGRAP